MFGYKCVVALFLLESLRLSPVNTENQCGIKGLSSGLIVGGKVSKRNDWPWIAALFNVQTERFFCGGTIISKNHVLTAAHCIHQKRFNSHVNAMSPDQIVVHLGKYNISANYERGSEAFYPTEIFIHPQWNILSERYDADIAIIRSETSIRFSNKILPICIWTSDTTDNEMFEGTVVGWGATLKTGANDHEEIPRQVQVNYVSSQQCYEDYHLFAAISSSRTFCAGGIEANSGPCSGDSGKHFKIFH